MKSLIALFAVMFMIVPVVAQAQQCRILEMADELKLTDKQIEQLRANMFANQKEMIQLKADLKKAKLEQREIMMAEEIDKKAALKKVEAISAIKASMAKKQMSARIDQLNILDAKQRAKIRRNMMLYGGKGKGRGHGMGPGMGSDMGSCMGTGMDHGKGMFHERGMGGRKNIEVIIEKKIIEDDE